MEKWAETASIEEQLKYEDEIFKVINELNRLFNEIRKVDKAIKIFEGVKNENT